MKTLPEFDRRNEATKTTLAEAKRLTEPSPLQQRINAMKEETAKLADIRGRAADRAAREASPVRGRVEVDTSKHPVVVYRLIGNVDAAVMAEYCAGAHVIEQAAQAKSIITIVDLTQLSAVPADARKVFAEAMARNEAEVARATRGLIVVLSSVVARAALTAVSWFAKFPCPPETASTLGEALTKADVILRGAK